MGEALSKKKSFTRAESLKCWLVLDFHAGASDQREKREAWKSLTAFFPHFLRVFMWTELTASAMFMLLLLSTVRMQQDQARDLIY